jgi:hypothetical protein
VFLYPKKDARQRKDGEGQKHLAHLLHLDLMIRVFLCPIDEHGTIVAVHTGRLLHFNPLLVVTAFVPDGSLEKITVGRRLRLCLYDLTAVYAVPNGISKFVQPRSVGEIVE